MPTTLNSFGTEEEALSEYKENCHEIGAIQEGSFLLVVRASENRPLYAVACSCNLIEIRILKVDSAAQVFNRPITDLLDEKSSRQITGQIRRLQETGRASVSTDAIGGRNFSLLHVPTVAIVEGVKVETLKLMSCSVVRSTADGDTYLVEFETVADETVNNFTFPHNHILQSGNINDKIRNGTTVEEVGSAFCDAVMELTAYDRGMLYRFGDDGSGDVIHENVRPGGNIVSSYLHLRFPKGDVPPITRYLYMKNRVRVISDIHGMNSKVLSADPLEKVDLTMSSLRASVPCHLIYMANMGVVSSMSIAIIVNDHLWGLYAFHCYSRPIRPSLELRVMLEMVASISAMRVDFLEREQFSKCKLDMHVSMQQLSEEVKLIDFLQHHAQSIMHLLCAHAIVVYTGETGIAMRSGDASVLPTEAGLAILNERCKMNSMLVLPSFPEGLAGDGTGVLFFKHYVMQMAIVRKSKAVDVRWAGVPDEVVDHNYQLTPRSSFNVYLEMARKECKSWLPADVEIAETFFERMIKHAHNKMLESFRTTVQQSNTEAAQAIEAAQKHYEFFAHMSHELRTPFHGVISSLQILKSGGESLHPAERFEMIDSALECGKSMLRTLDDILTIAKSRNGDDTVQSPVILSKLLGATKILMAPIAETKDIVFTVSAGIKRPPASEVERLGVFDGFDWPTLMVSSDALRLSQPPQVANNFINNAMKFTPRCGTVSVRAYVMDSTDAAQYVLESGARYQCVRLLGLKGKTEEVYRDGTKVEVVQQGVDLPPRPSTSISSVPALPLEGVEGEGKGVGKVGSAVLQAEIQSRLAGKGSYYVMEVEDSGLGISGPDMLQLFTAYKQVSSGVTKIYQGTGLGLHICKCHADSMGGLIGVASTEGKGTLFVCAFPVTLIPRDIAVDLPAVAPSSNKRSASIAFQTVRKESDKRTCREWSLVEYQQSPDSTKKRQVSAAISKALFLLVDDSTVNLRLTKRKIQIAFEDKCKVVVRGDGQEAIVLFEEMLKSGRSEEITGIFMDYHMPICSGLQAIQSIRRQEKESGVAADKAVLIAAFTADLCETSRNDLLSSGADEVLGKPTPNGKLEEICFRMILARGLN